jgi:hypothetical protein
MLEPAIEPPKFDKFIMEECKKELDKMPENINSWNTVLEYKAKDVKAYKECYEKHKALVNSVNKYTEEFK